VAKSLQLKKAIWAYLLINWSVLAYAADNSSLVNGIEAIPLKAFLYVFALSVVGGAAGTLTKLTRTDIVVRNLTLEIAKDILASLVAGLLVFFFSSWWSNVNFWLQAGLVTLAGYGGSKVLDTALADGLGPWLNRVFGKLPEKNG
jgi:hypothetical protein